LPAIERTQGRGAGDAASSGGGGGGGGGLGHDFAGGEDPQG
jgi:hypothetical protein